MQALILCLTVFGQLFLLQPTANVASINESIDKLHYEVPLAPSSAPALLSATSDFGVGSWIVQ